MGHKSRQVKFYQRVVAEILRAIWCWLVSNWRMKAPEEMRWHLRNNTGQLTNWIRWSFLLKFLRSSVSWGHDFLKNLQALMIFLLSEPDQADMMKRAISEIERDTCITFIERTNQMDYIKIINGNGCNSNVGKVGGLQNITLQIPECLFKGNILHNLMHSVIH